MVLVIVDKNSVLHRISFVYKYSVIDKNSFVVIYSCADENSCVDKFSPVYMEDGRSIYWQISQGQMDNFPAFIASKPFHL